MLRAGNSNQQNSSCTATYLPSYKPSKYGMLSIAEKVRMLSLATVDRQLKTYIHQLCADIGCILEDVPRAINEWII